MNQEEIKDLVLSENNYLESNPLTKPQTYNLQSKLQEVIDILKIDGCNSKKLAIIKLNNIIKEL